MRRVAGVRFCGWNPPDSGHAVRGKLEMESRASGAGETLRERGRQSHKNNRSVGLNLPERGSHLSESICIHAS